MARVVPAIQVETAERYQEQLRIIRRLTSRFQLDVIDPAFADVVTVDPAHIEVPTDMQCDVHIMSPHPTEYFEKILHLHPRLIIIQFETVEDLPRCIEILQGKEVGIGLSINPATEVSAIEAFIDQLDNVQVMGYPAGPSGRTLQPAALHKVAELRTRKQNLEVGLDGGVQEGSLAKIAKANFDIVNVTSYLFGADDVMSRYSELMEALG